MRIIRRIKSYFCSHEWKPVQNSNYYFHERCYKCGLEKRTEKCWDDEMNKQPLTVNSESEEVYCSCKKQQPDFMYGVYCMACGFDLPKQKAAAEVKEKEKFCDLVREAWSFVDFEGEVNEISLKEEVQKKVKKKCIDFAEWLETPKAFDLRAKGCTYEELYNHFLKQ